MDQIIKDGQVFNLVPAETIYEAPVSRTAFINQPEEVKEAVNVDDINNVTERFKEVLTRQNIKGHEKYQTSLVDAELSELELIEHLEEEAVDLWQYAQVLRRKLEVQHGED